MALARSSTLVPKIIAARGLEFLRENAVMPRLVQNLSDNVVAQKGDIITLPDSDAQTVKDVTVGATPPAPTQATIAAKYVTLNQWRKTDFGITDKEIGEILDSSHFVPVQMQEAMRALANDVDRYILQLYSGIYNFSGVAGTTPFATNLAAFRDSRIALNNDLAPIDGRNVVLDPDAEGNAIVLEQFLAADRRGDQGGIINGEIGRKLGANWYMNQNVDHASGAKHTAGTWAITGTGYTEVKAAATAGTSTFIIQGNSSTTTNGGNLKVGDVFKVTGDTRSYRVKTAASVAVGAQATLAVVVDPVFRVTVAAGATVVFAGGADATDSVNNLMFHPNAFAFASRPMVTKSNYMGGNGPVSSTVRDPVSGIAVRFELIREYKQWLMDFDILYGATLVRPQLASRILG
jgi:hypothetical protein